jgi:hypothetical protein
MPQLNRHYCSRCQTAIYNCMIDGQRVPILLYFVVGQPDDTGVFDANGAGVRLPSFVREIMQAHVPVARAELCMNCVSELFGVELVTAQEDSMYSIEQTKLTAVQIRAVATDSDIPAVQKAATVMDRVFLAFQVGRGALTAPPLPPPAPKAAPIDPALIEPPASSATE